jgi:hypothetical protein
MMRTGRWSDRAGSISSCRRSMLTQLARYPLGVVQQTSLDEPASER